MDSYVSRLEQDNARLRAALRVYANKGYWAQGIRAEGTCHRCTWRGPHPHGPYTAKVVLDTPAPERTGPLLRAAVLDEDDGAMPDDLIWWGGGLREMGTLQGGGT